MSILINENTRVLVQGITGREGMVRTRLMLDYGTKVVAGCTPGKGGADVYRVPVFDTVLSAWEEAGPIDAAAIFVPAPLVKEAALEAIDAGIKLLVIVPDRVPIYDVLTIAEKAEEKGARFIGPNTLGVLSPGKATMGMIGGRAENARNWFKPGPVGVASRSGGITSSISYYLNKKAGIGQTTIIHVGGDAVLGLPLPDVMKLFEKDPETKMVVMFGEIGTTQEERVADLIEKGEFTKPLVAFIGGAAATSGTRFSHAGAIIEGGRGTYEGKLSRLKEVGAHIVRDFGDIPEVAADVLKGISQKGRMKMGELHWKTAITRVEPNKLLLKGYRIDELMGRINFPQVIYLALTGELPDDKVGRMIDAILVSSIDHGATPPSVLSVLTVASTGAPLNAALAAGVLSISRFHGGAIEGCMRILIAAKERVDRGEGNIAEIAEKVVAECKEAKKRIPGYGHRYHTDDPRSKRLFALAHELGIAGAYLELSKELEKALESSSGKKLPLNVDGAIAAVLCELSIPPEIGNAFFIMARLPGLVAHIHEEMTRMKPMRKIHPTDHEYDGPPERNL
jgi:succinyl-CoA synthetase alpha subunit